MVTRFDEGRFFVGQVVPVPGNRVIDLVFGESRAGVAAPVLNLLRVAERRAGPRTRRITGEDRRLYARTSLK